MGSPTAAGIPLPAGAWVDFPSVVKDHGSFYCREIIAVAATLRNLDSWELLSLIFFVLQNDSQKLAVFYSGAPFLLACSWRVPSVHHRVKIQSHLSTGPKCLISCLAERAAANSCHLLPPALLLAVPTARFVRNTEGPRDEATSLRSSAGLWHPSPLPRWLGWVWSGGSALGWHWGLWLSASARFPASSTAGGQ